MRKITAVLFALSLALTPPGCAKDQPRDPTPDATKPDPRPEPRAQERPARSSSHTDSQVDASEPPGLDASQAMVVPEPPEVGSIQFHREASVVDLHVDTLYQLYRHGGSLAERFGNAEVSVDLIGRGGLDAQFFAIWVPPDDLNARQIARQEVRLFEKAVVGHPRVEQARGAADLRRIIAAGKIGALLSLEGTAPLEGQPELMRKLYAKGVRMASLTWNEDNTFATGAKTRSKKGLSDQGVRLLRLMEDLGIVVDVSHASQATFWDIIARSRYPVVASHSNAASVHGHRRNLDDAQLWAIRDTGGVVGLNFHSRFLSSRGRATIKDVLVHARHLRKVMGPEHLALGSDFDGQIVPPGDLDNVSRLPSLTRALAADGFAAPALKGLLGGNVLRVLDRVERRAKTPGKRFYPARIRKTLAPGRKVGTLMDRNVLTAWDVEGAGGHPPSMTFKTSEVGVRRLTLCGTPGLVLSLEIESGSGERLLVKRIVLPERSCPHRVGLSSLECRSGLTFKISVPEGGPGQTLAEVLPERTLAPSCPRSGALE